MGIDINKLNNAALKVGMSWSDIAKKSGISKQHISNIRNGKVDAVRLPTIKALADAMNIEPLELTKEGE